MKTFTCDWCGNPNAMEDVVCLKRESDHVYVTSYDLCPDCRRKITRFSDQMRYSKGRAGYVDDPEPVKPSEYGEFLG